MCPHRRRAGSPSPDGSGLRGHPPGRVPIRRAGPWPCTRSIPSRWVPPRRWHSIRSTQLSAVSRSLGVIAPPQLDSGPYLSYGPQGGWRSGSWHRLGLGYFIWSEVTTGATRLEAVEQSATPTTNRTPRAHVSSSKRAQTRADLQRASSGAATTATSQATDAAGIGHGPDTAHSEAAVREKSSRRYGG